MLAFHHEIEAQRATPRLRHRRRGLQGRPARLAAAARLRLAQSALGDRAQVSGREGDDRRQGDRDSGRAHRRAHADRAARAGDRRRRGGVERDAAQRGRDRAARRAHRRHGDDPARRRRHPAGARRGAGAAAEGVEAVQISQATAPVRCNTAVVRDSHRAAARRACAPAAPASSPARIRRSST